MKKANFIKMYLDKKLGIDISDRKKSNEYVFARALYFKLCGIYAGLTLSNQAKIVNRDHSTAIYSNNNVIDYVLTVPMYKKIFIEACMVMQTGVSTEVLDPMGEMLEDAIITENNKAIVRTISDLVDSVRKKQDKILEMELEPHERAYRELPTEKQLIFRERAEAILRMI
jgi:hypothetical protein